MGKIELQEMEIGMKQFRLPRKIKKTLKGFWLYPADEMGGSLMASPSKYEKDYKALQAGLLRNLNNRKDSKQRRKEFREKLDKEVFVSDEELKRYVNEIFHQYFQISSYDTLLEAKKKPKAIIAYFNFVNAYQLHEAGDDSFGNICCLAVDKARELVKARRKR